MARIANIKRSTNETEIDVTVDLDGTGQSKSATQIGFFDHMLDQLARHSLLDIDVKAKGDLHIDFHHTVEDVGIALGQAVSKALGDKRGIRRFSFSFAPLDEALSRVVVDISGRPYLIWNVAFSKDKIGDFDTELFREFFNAFAQNAGITLHVENLYGINNHHIAESCFKSLAKALRVAVEIDDRARDTVPSTKGML